MMFLAQKNFPTLKTNFRTFTFFGKKSTFQQKLIMWVTWPLLNCWPIKCYLLTKLTCQGILKSPILNTNSTLFWAKSTLKIKLMVIGWDIFMHLIATSHHRLVNHRRKRGEKSETTITQCKKQLSSGEGGVIVLKRMSSFHSSNVK